MASAPNFERVSCSRQEMNVWLEPVTDEEYEKVNRYRFTFII